MPRKRKAQHGVPLISDEAKRGRNKQRIKNGDDDALEDKNEGGEEEAHDVVKICKEQVDLKVEAFVDAVQQRVQMLRADADAIIRKIPKQVRLMPAVEVFALTPTESAAGTLQDVLSRLQALQQGSHDSKIVDIARIVSASLAAVGEAVPAVASAPQPVDAGDPCAAVQEGQEQQQEQCGTLSSQAPAASPNKLAQAAVLMPPPPARLPLGAAILPARQPRVDEVFYSANGSPIHFSQVTAPVTAVKGMLSCLPDMTPAVGANTVIAPPTVEITGCTFRRMAPTRGRVKQPTRAITVKTKDGKQFTVDDLIGMAAVPQAYHDEVRQLLKADVQDLNALMATLEQDNDNTSSATAGASHPTRRR
ncbi:hypothetical protein VaNZ11_011937 [Volvox africanus]|uniref:Borealin N-terminal domain-containing protein n=1 Tax=Volvox africanus TaxID=51714 RepID=A0ABQ5SCV7_9CHLO|nr:hypothetical protein VaNZ11_011937 [Volvox africanus]